MPEPDTAIIQEVISEADFYMEHDLLTDARIVLDELAKSAPNHQLLRSRRSQLNNIAKILRELV